MNSDIPAPAVPASNPAPAPGRLSLLHRLGPLLLLTIFGFALSRLIRTLNRIPNSPEEFERHGDWLVYTIAALGILLLAGPVLGSRWAPLARAHRFAGNALGLALLFWWLPAPFFITRFLSWILLYTIAGIYIALTLRTALLPKRGPAPIPTLSPWWTAGAAIAAILASLLADKYNSLAFSVAID